MIPTRHLPWGFAILLVAGCSLLNKPDDIKPAGGGGAGGSTTNAGGAGAQCKNDEGCASLTVGCQKGICDTATGTCKSENVPAGTACGDAKTSDCDAADTCDASGSCVTNLVANGTYCADCPAGPGKCTLCQAGQCGDCGGRATEKTFRSPFSTAGWKFTGGWGLYEQTPPSSQPAVVFPRPVVGTDGNRAHPYPGQEVEQSSATTPPGVIPPVLQFLSWNYDEGGPYDQKTISISIDGGASFTTVAVCLDTTTYPFCTPFAGTWSPISVDLAAVGHPELIGQVGVVRFAYNTNDGCCAQEQGWYIDQLNFATDCACHTDPECSSISGTCGDGTCDLLFNECFLASKNLGGACGDATNATCSGPDTCDSNGLCNINYEPKEGLTCDSCTDGVGECLACGGGTCLSCPPLQTFETLSPTGWTFTGGWGVYSTPPAQQPPPAMQYVPFGMHGNVLGVDGTPAPPYWMNGSHIVAVETSYVRSPPTLIPAQIKFQSWNVDRGGQSGRDEKRIRVSTDMGTTWKTLVDCQGANNTLPFCTQVTTRNPDAWDDISIDTGALAGQTAIVEFSYDSLDTGNGFEQGWYIDNLNIVRCGGY